MTEIVQRSPLQNAVATIRSKTFAEQIAAALPGNVTVERFQRVTVTALQQTPEIANSDQNALFRAVIRCAQDGLLPDGREAALVMFGNAATYMPMIGGFRKIAAENGWAIDTHVVYANDEFKYELGVEPRLIHKPAPLNEQPGDKIGAYAVATHSDGRKIVEVLRAADIAKVRAVSKAKGRGPWVDWEERMWEKTAGRRIFGKLPLAGRDVERIKSVLEASDAEYELGDSPEVTAVASTLTAAVPPDDGPDDDYTPIEGEVLDPVAEPEGNVSSTFTPPTGPRGGAK